MSDKIERQQRLRSLIADRDLGSQRAVRDALAGDGIATTQATISRDLDEIGAVKVRGADGTLIYRLSVDPGPASARERLDLTLRQFVVGVRSSGNLVVLRTPPACASPVASAIDLAELPEILATVAGDDTVVVVAAEAIPGVSVAADLRARAGI